MRWTVRSLAMLLALVMSLAVDTPIAGAGGGPVWHREPGGRLSAVTADAAGNIFVTGQIWAPPAGGDRDHRWAMTVAKYGPSGRLAWRRTWRVRKSGWWAHGRAVAPAPGGGVYVGGTSGWYEDEYPVVWRYGATGRLLWRRTLAISIERADVEALAADAHGVVAAVDSVGSCCDDVRHDGDLQALDPSGRPTWRTDFEVPGITGTWDAVGTVGLGKDGHVYAAGHVDRSFFDSPDNRAPDEDVVVQQLSRAGTVRWTSVVVDGRKRDQESANAIAVREGLVIVTASINDETRAWVGAFVVDGRRRWMHRWGRDYWTGAVAVAAAPWGPVYVATNHAPGGGVTPSTTAALRRYAPNGTFVWQHGVANGELVTGITAGDALYLTVGEGLERWRR